MLWWHRKWIRAEGLLVLIGGPLFAAIGSHDKSFIELTVGLSLIGCLVISRFKWGEKADERSKYFDERWERLEPKRQKAADIILESPDNPGDISEDIIDFFNDLGSSLEEHELKTKTVWNDHSINAQYYWEVCFRQVIRKQKGDESDVWSGFFWLYDKLVKQRGIKQRTPQQIVEYFKAELAD